MSSDAQNVVIAGFTDDQTCRLTGVTLRQLHYWASDRFFIPSIELFDPALAGVRLYSFRDLVCLKIINILRNKEKVPLQHLRDVKNKLSHLGDGMWAKTTLYVLNRRVVIRNDETGTKEEAVSGQGVLQIPLAVVSGNMEEAIRALRSRPSVNLGKIDAGKGNRKNPVIQGTRIPVKTIKEFAAEGYTVQQITEQFPSLNEADIQAAINYEVAA